MHTLGMCTHPLEALPQGAVCLPAHLPEAPDGLPGHGEHGQDQPLLRGKELLEAALVDAGRQISSTPTAVQPRAYLEVLAPSAIFGHRPKMGWQECND